MTRHKDFLGDEAIHQSAYIQTTDPGAVGAWKIWVDITTPSAVVFKYRNSGNSAWTTITADASGKQPLDATLTALAGLASTAGVIEQTSGDVFAIRLIGTANATDLLTRSGGDGRFAALSHTHAAGDVVSGQLALARGGTNADLSATGPGWHRQASSGAATTVRELLSTDLPAGSITNVAPAGLVSGYHHRYSATSVHSGLANGDPVTTFDDLGSDNNALTTISGATDRPTYYTDPDGDGLAAVEWDGSNDGMRVLGLTAYTGTDLAIFGVIRNVTNVAGNLIRFDDQSHGALTVQNATMNWATSGNATVSNRNGGSVSARSTLNSATGIGGADFRGSWMVFAWIWGSVQSTYILRYYENHYQMSSPAIASSAFAWTRIAIGASPNDSTDAWVGGTYNAIALRELVIYKASTFASREDLIKQNMQYLATACKVAAWL
jgi:hypothetical protein